MLLLGEKKRGKEYRENAGIFHLSECGNPVFHYG